MKVLALTLCLAALAQAQLSYRLSCAPPELGILWPSYESNSEYYVCSSRYGEQMTIYCRDGEVFTFVLQQCTTPDRFIPPPPKHILPTVSDLSQTVVQYPKPPTSAEFLQPPIIDNVHHIPPAMHTPPIAHMPNVVAQTPQVPAEALKPENVIELSPPIMGPAILGPSIEETAALEQEPVQEIVPPVPPMPPTPAPTPPKVNLPVPIKKPVPSLNSPKKPTTVKKPAPVTAAAKKPAPAPIKAAKKPQAITPKKPIPEVPRKTAKKPAPPTISG